MRVVQEARNQVPVQVRHEIAETRHVHLVRREQRAKRGLDTKHDAHQVLAILHRQGRSISRTCAFQMTRQKPTNGSSAITTRQRPSSYTF
jgi:hypothetical protein